MFACPMCGILYHSKREADLCTPRERWAERYPNMVPEIGPENSMFSDQKVDQEND